MRGALRAQKTVPHEGHTLAHGSFHVRETIYECAAGCLDAEGHIVTLRQPEVAEVLLPRRQVGYDVMTFIGLRRFVKCEQREEIQVAIEKEYGCYGYTLSTGEISKLTRLFLEYLEALHVARAPELAKALARDGGWPLHIDATGEDGRGTLLGAYAGWRGWVLGAWKIPTERADVILPCLNQVAARFGDPCAIMRDLGKAVIEASRDFVAKRGLKIPDLGCHFHALRDIGKDLLKESHNELKALFSRYRVSGRLKALARDLGRGLGAEIDDARNGVTMWLSGPSDNLQVPDGPAGLGVVRALAQWTFDFHQDGDNEGFPFDQPYLDFYQRCYRTLRAVEAHLCAPWDDGKVRSALERLHRIVEPVRGQLPFQRPASILKERVALFTELRQALRLRVKPERGERGRSADPAKQIAELRDIKAAVDALTTSLRERRPQRGPAQHTREAIDIVLVHLDRHGPSLWGHEIALPDSVGGGVRLVDRTNTLLELFWHRMKHGERRRSGRKVLSHDFEQLPATAALALNLTHADYVEILCGSLDQLHHAFAALDAERRRPQPLDQGQAPQESLPKSDDGDGDDADGVDNADDEDEPDIEALPRIASASMPIEDRPLIRDKSMQARISRAVASRAPRWSAS
jgi:hypothetical protein